MHGKNMPVMKELASPGHWLGVPPRYMRQQTFYIQLFAKIDLCKIVILNGLQANSSF
jgi:hypothetical protein